ncbi:MAG: DUF3298 and DUF4163 domain-containing protein [Lachnospirales bacterium]
MYPKLLFQLFLLSKPKHSKKLKDTELPKITTIEEKETYKSKEGKELLKASYIYPKISYNESVTFENTVNNFFKEKQEGYKKEEKDALISAENLYEEFPDTSLLPYSINTNYNTTLNIENNLSFKLYYDSYLGGAHGIALVKGGTFNPKYNRAMIYYDFFIKDKEKVDKTLNYLIEKNIEEQGLTEYLFPYEKGKLPLPEGDSFYLLPKGMVFIYNVYEIAPYSAGTIFVTLGYNELCEIWEG